MSLSVNLLRPEFQIQNFSAVTNPPNRSSRVFPQSARGSQRLLGLVVKRSARTSLAAVAALPTQSWAGAARRWPALQAPGLESALVVGGGAGEARAWVIALPRAGRSSA